MRRRLQVRKDLQAKAAAPEPEAKPETADEDGEDGKEVALLAEMSGLKEAADRRLKKEKKRKREAKTKARVRAAQMALGAPITTQSLRQLRDPSELSRMLICPGIVGTRLHTVPW